MRPLLGWLQRCAGLFTGNRREKELTDELDAHLELHIGDNLRAGMTPDEARRKALMKLGGLEPAKEAYRDGGTIPFLENVFRDVRFALRQLRKNPSFTCIAVLVFALGLCASVSLFAFVDAALIKPLPYLDPSRLVYVTEKSAQLPHANLSYPDYIDWKRRNRVFSSLEVFTNTGFLLDSGGGATPVPGVRVSDGFFHTLGVTPVLGRDFRPGEDTPKAPNTVILSYGAWQTRFGGPKDIIGRTLRLSGVSYTVIGVLPASFQFALRGPAEFWIPLRPNANCEQMRHCHDLLGIARLDPGVSLPVALSDTQSIARQLEQEYPRDNRGQGANVVPLAEAVVGEIRPILLTLLGAGLLLLLIACINIASLLLVRSESRRREIAVRSSLGASSIRLITQFVTESFVLVALGSVFGLIFADGAMKILLKLIPADMLGGMPYLQGVGLNSHALLFAAGVVFIAGLLFSSVPTLHLYFSELRGGLTEGSRGSAGRSWRRLGSHLVVVELAVAMVLLVGAGLLSKSLHHLLHVELGFQPDHLATIHIAAPASRYAKDEKIIGLERDVLERAQGLPGVQSAGLIDLLPVGYNSNTDWIRFVGRPYHGEHNEVNSRDVSPSYFETIQARLLQGRYFTEADSATSPHVAIINQSLAKKYFPGQNPIGQRFGNDDLDPKSIRQIVGVVADIRDGSLDSEIWPAEYLPYTQSPDANFSLIVRTVQSGGSVLSSLREVIRRIDPQVGTLDESLMPERIARSPSAYLHRSSAWLVSGFAGLALLLGVIGLYGVVAYSVAQRTREIGIRMALGAENGTVLQLILKEAGWLALWGLAGGTVCALFAATLMSKLLFDVQSWDVPTLLGAAGVLGLAALLASFIPARRAAAVNPVEALRAE
jgi:predicted permease